MDIYSNGIPFEVDLLTFNGEIDDTCIPGNTPPVADAGPDQHLECPDTEAVQVTLDGSGSYDPDYDPLSYIWTGPFGTATEVNPEVILPYWGTWTIPLTVDDGNGGADSDEIKITIGDTTPPTTTASVIGVKGENGVYTSEVTVTLTSTDDCTGVKDIHYIINGKEHSENFNPAVNTGSVSFTLSEDGSHVITYWAVDDARRVGTTGATSINAAPSTGGGGGSGSGGYYRGCVTVDLQTDSDTGELVYSLDGGATWNTYTGEFTICEERKEVTVSYGYRAPGGNVENPKTLVIKIDRTPPTITAVVQPPANASGWHNTDVTVTFTCDDATSGVAECTSPVTVTTEGAGQVVTGTAVDKAGNTATTSVSLNIDKTAPHADISVTPGLLWPPNHKTVDVAINGGASDAVSEVASMEFTVTDEYGTVEPSVGGFDTTIPLEAWRKGGDRDGRHYTITAVITDNAGNKTIVSTEAVVPHDMRGKK